MPFDAVFLSAVNAELRSTVLGCRIDKIQQPEKHTLLLQIHSRDFTGRLLLCASPNSPRVHLTRVSLENPPQPPMFCMLLRKHLTGARIAEITQPPMERLVDFTLECTDELGEPCRRHLIAELMGRSANLILCDGDGRIIDCLRRIDLETCDRHPVLPGLFYRLPPLAQKHDPAAISQEALTALLEAAGDTGRLDSWLLDTFGGLSPLVCRELSFRATGETDGDLSLLPDRAAAAEVIYSWFRDIAQGQFVPTVLLQDDHPREFSYGPILQYGSSLRRVEAESFGQLLDSFYAQRDHADRMRQRTHSLQKTLTTLHNRVVRKLETQRKELAEAADRERLRQLGDIVTANLHAICRGQAVLTATDFYDPEMKEIQIPLNVTLSPQQNAARFYKDYTRAKNAEKFLTQQIQLGEADRDYLSSVLDALSRAESDRDVLEIRQELVEGGYVRSGEKKRIKTPASRPLEFVSPGGFPILVGRNNRQNDILTLKTAQKRDLWFHIQGRPGSHVILCCQGQPPEDEDITCAAELAAWYSQGRTDSRVSVDLAEVRHVKKPAGAKPGMVIYDHYRTVFVAPCDHKSKGD